MMDTKKTDKKKLLLRILVPVFIAAALIIMWAVKTNRTPTPIDEQTEIIEDFVLEVTSIDLDALKKYGMPIIIDFGADTCAPCKEMFPALVAMNLEMQGKAIIKFVDVWKHNEAANEFPLQVIPTQVFINADGTPYVPSSDSGIQFDMYSHKNTGEHTLTLHQGGLTVEQMRTILDDMEVTK